MDDWEDCSEEVMFLPVGPWEQNLSERDRQVALLIRENGIQAAESVRPLLLAAGYPAGAVDEMASQMVKGLKTGADKLYVKVSYVWARKKHV